MMMSENRFALFGIMLRAHAAKSVGWLERGETHRRQQQHILAGVDAAVVTVATIACLRQ
jgi:hypothetical protein